MQGGGAGIIPQSRHGYGQKMESAMGECPCCSGVDFDECCGPLLAGEEAARTAEALMRSRYTAHVREEYPYIIATTHASIRPPDDEYDDYRKIDWCGLEIVATEGGGADDERGVVEFIARYRAGGGTLGHHEVARFEKEEGKWYYLDGDMAPQRPVRSEKIGRNQPCPCGSGRKYKKCCYHKG